MRTKANSLGVLPIVAAFALNAVVGPLAPIARIAASPARATGVAGTLNIEKVAGPSPIAAGQGATFTVLVWNAGPEDAPLTSVHDELPDDVDWHNPVIVNADGDDSCSMASSIGPDGIEHWSFDCEFGSLPASEMPEAPFDEESPGKVITITGDTDRDDCGVLLNQAWAESSGGDPVGPAEASVEVECPTLTVEKTADTEAVHIAFDAEGMPSVDPEQVTWTLAYTLGGGTVTNAVITDPLPEFLTFVSASRGGVHDPASGVITWELGTLTTDGSVRVVTSVDPEAPETEPIVNVATIVSDGTPEDHGADEIRVTSSDVLGGNPPTAKPSVPDTALGMGPDGAALTVPVELLAVLFVGALGTLAFARVRSMRRPR